MDLKEIGLKEYLNNKGISYARFGEMLEPQISRQAVHNMCETGYVIGVVNGKLSMYNKNKIRKLPDNFLS